MARYTNVDRPAHAAAAAGSVHVRLVVFRAEIAQLAPFTVTVAVAATASWVPVNWRTLGPPTKTWDGRPRALVPRASALALVALSKAASRSRAPSPLPARYGRYLSRRHGGEGRVRHVGECRAGDGLAIGEQSDRPGADADAAVTQTQQRRAVHVRRIDAGRVGCGGPARTQAQSPPTHTRRA